MEEDYTARMELKECLAVSTKRKADYLRLKAGARRHAVGDTPTAAFFAQAAARQTARGITSLLHPTTAETVSDASGIEELLLKFWGGVFGDPLHVTVTPPTPAAMQQSIARLHRKLSPADALLMDADISTEEVTAAMKRGWVHAAPGPDGLPRIFYKHYWSLFETPMLELALAVQRGETLPQVFNQGVVALLPKVDEPILAPGQFRPITLLNIDYKIIAGVLAARLKCHLGGLVHETQTGFVPGRQIMENVTYTRDVTDWSKSTQNKAYIAFLDFEKAFDMANWRYRDEVLRALGSLSATLRCYGHYTTMLR